MYGENGYLTEVLDYDGPVVYRDGAPDYILTGEGRLVFGEEKEPVYEYFLADHLGNTRVTFRVAGDSVSVVQENHYYPFGLSMAGLDNSGLQEEDATQNPYLYNGKEFQGDEGLGWYDYGARFYDAQVERWWSVDALIEREFNNGPYNYVQNNPVARFDPNGKLDTKFEDEEGNLLYETKDNVDAIITVARDKVDGFKKEVEGISDDILTNPQIEKKTTVDLAGKYMKKGQAVSYTLDNQGNIRNLSIGEAAQYSVHQVGIRMLGGIGTIVTIAGGITWDSKGNIGLYGSVGGGTGADLSLGVE